MAIKRNQNPNPQPKKQERLTNTKKNQVQDNLEESIRPHSFDEYIGQKDLKDVLSIVCKKLHPASSYKVSEMVKSVENAYRHMDITLANQLSLAFPKDNIREVLKLVVTKWNV